MRNPNLEANIQLRQLGAYKDFGLLVLRVGAGILIITHGLPKLAGGPTAWSRIGASMGLLGIKFVPVLWGFLAAAAEGIGGLLIVLGLFFRPAAFLALFTMVVAAYKHLSTGDGLKGAEMAILYGIIFFSLFILGPGSYSVDKK
ncbi:MAG: DoxX family protein [Sphingobacteriaceae bacterium]|nr:MAG: DoxX family protein [Sphingobacteriaceae bacterium]